MEESDDATKHERDKDDDEEQDDDEENELQSDAAEQQTSTAQQQQQQIPQAYRSSFNQTIAPANTAPLVRVIRPPVDFPDESKRAQLIEDAEVDLETDMDELQRAVHAYNVDFQRRIDEVKARGRTLDAQIRSEYEAMEESMNQLQHEFKSGFERSFLTLQQKTLSHFAHVETQDVANQERRIRACESDARAFFYTTVPEIMENLQGTITRKLEKHHETFDIENAKTQKRERKTASALESNEIRTASHFHVERERRNLKFREREEDFHHVMRVDNRSSEAQQRTCVDTLVSLRAQLQEESQVRQRDDLAILDKVGASFHRLQSSILENLGESTT